MPGWDFSGMELPQLRQALAEWYLKLQQATEVYSALLEEFERRFPRKEPGWSE